MSVEDIFNDYFPTVGELGGDLWNIYRPDYTAVDNAPVLVHSNVKWRCDPVGYKFAEPNFDGVNYYDMFGERALIQPGDVLMRAVPDGQTPAITVAHLFPMKAVTGFRTSRKGKLTNSVEDPNPIYDNVYFDFLNIGFPGSALNRNLEASLRIPSTRAVMYKRNNIYRLRTHLIETDSSVMIEDENGNFRPYERKWLVEEIDWSGTQMVLTLRNV